VGAFLRRLRARLGAPKAATAARNRQTGRDGPRREEELTMDLCTPCPSRERLERLLAASGQLGAADYQALEQHTQACPTCRARLEQLLHDAETEKWQKLLGARPSPTTAEEDESGLPLHPEEKAVPLSGTASSARRTRPPPCSTNRWSRPITWPTRRALLCPISYSDHP
jgi:hypothetical protein